MYTAGHDADKSTLLFLFVSVYLPQSLCQCFHLLCSVGLPGFAAFFRASSLEERDHAQMLMDFQASDLNTVPYTGVVLSISQTKVSEFVVSIMGAHLRMKSQSLHVKSHSLHTVILAAVLVQAEG